MTHNVKVVTAFVPLNVRHMTADKYKELGHQMLAKTDGRYLFFEDEPLQHCWLWNELTTLGGGDAIWKTPATETPKDRYDTPEDHVCSHIVQHNRTTWALETMYIDPSVDVIVWLDLAILKQGVWNGNPVLPDDIPRFLDAVSKMDLNTIPFPGIEGKKPVDPHGNNWRFCGSTHIWPVKFLPAIDRTYKFELRRFLWQHRCVPLDLAIWPLVEANSGLPFQWYKAEYDATQLRNFPCPK